MKNILPLAYFKDHIKIVDQTKLPLELKYVSCRNERDVSDAIKKMKIRGAPAIGIAGAFGLYLGIRNFKSTDKDRFIKRTVEVAEYLAESRPTAVNLSWALEELKKKVLHNYRRSIGELKDIAYKEAVHIMQDDQKRCRLMGAFGAKLIKNKDVCLTICNAGGMATSGYGTALGVFFKAKEDGRKFEVFACETRPLLQGARITSWELMQKKIKTTLICDSMAASLIKRGIIKKIFVGADRITLSGDFANKIGTYNLAVLAKFHNIPFYVVAPLSTFDKNLKSGKDIPIEFRNKDEITSLYFKKRIAPPGVRVVNPAFDVSDAKLVSAFVTEKGLIKPPYKINIRKIIHAQ
ncbi:MAG: S-methyl-5-thioribose-1-phosphate isomerase [Candidatus Omnitrophica bacterium]|nr:S-methyl-5-thioribose-1-phosphate isomerase [Candidatus Omnitrophota bacterium]MDD5351944.1 S-methyl-5-thioribose-1-phosphate isomerase [Candidatus Omnitrophota bacterium]MDD5550770.1 S-methyl-5-thioribose-1-phosphate isomerase [Candidatus Omnitrophota bacterium]